MPVCLLWRNVYLDLLSIFFKEIILFIYFWLCWLFIAVWAFSSCTERVILSVAMHRILMAVSSLVVEHELCGYDTWAQ